MIPILLLGVPPSIATSGYYCWYSGQRLILKNQNNEPNQTFASYFAGIASLGGAYYIQSLAFPIIEGGTLAARELNVRVTSSNQYKEGGAGKYVPPKDMFELVRRVGPPVTLRIVASSLAFFCAGIAQTYVALRPMK